MGVIHVEFSKIYGAGDGGLSLLRGGSFRPAPHVGGSLSGRATFLCMLLQVLGQRFSIPVGAGGRHPMEYRLRGFLGQAEKRRVVIEEENDA